MPHLSSMGNQKLYRIVIDVQYGDIPVNNDDEIEEDFLNFPVGTSKIDVWHWFDERCPNNLHDDLMYPKNDAV